MMGEREADEGSIWSIEMRQFTSETVIQTGVELIVTQHLRLPLGCDLCEVEAKRKGGIRGVQVVLVNGDDEGAFRGAFLEADGEPGLHVIGQGSGARCGDHDNVSFGGVQEAS